MRRIERIIALAMTFLVAFVLTSCDDASVSDLFDSEGTVYKVVYNGNGATGGAAPMDNAKYVRAGAVTVLGKGTLESTGCVFIGWNTKSDGTGTMYRENGMFRILGNTILYAQWVEGVLCGEFSMPDGKTVRFSKGNLQAKYSSATSSYSWGFAGNQYEYIGNNVGNTSIDSQGDAQKVDLFGWVGVTGSGDSYGINSKTEAGVYGKSIDLLKSDWGNIESLPGNSSAVKIWRTLTKDEWVYLINSRPNASNLCKFGVTVAGHNNCFVIAPDNFKGTIASTYSENEWATAEAAGLVCLPAAGGRSGVSVSSFGSGGNYWSSTAMSESNAYKLDFTDSSVTPASNYNRYTGYSVRLVFVE